MYNRRRVNNSEEDDSSSFLDRFGRKEKSGVGGREHLDHVGGSAAAGTLGFTDQHLAGAGAPAVNPAETQREQQLLQELASLQNEHEAMTKVLRELHNSRYGNEQQEVPMRRSDQAAVPSFEHQPQVSYRAQVPLMPAEQQGGNFSARGEGEQYGNHPAEVELAFDADMFGNNALPESARGGRGLGPKKQAANPKKRAPGGKFGNKGGAFKAQPAPMNNHSFTFQDTPHQYPNSDPYGGDVASPGDSWGMGGHAQTDPTLFNSRQGGIEDEPPSALMDSDRDAIEALFATDDFEEKFNRGGDIYRYPTSPGKGQIQNQYGSHQPNLPQQQYGGEMPAPNQGGKRGGGAASSPTRKQNMNRFNPAKPTNRRAPPPASGGAWK